MRFLGAPAAPVAPVAPAIPAVLAALLAAPALAGATFDVPFFRGSAGSIYAGWESFTIPVGGDNAPTDPASNTTSAFVRQTNPGAIIAGSGNLYSSFNVPNFEVGFNGSGTPVSFLVIQVRTQGLELDWNNVALDWTGFGGSGTLGATRTELYRDVQSAPGGASFDIISRFDFDLTGALFDSFTLTLPSVNQLISLDRVELDIGYIPTPGTGVAGLLALGAVGARRRR